MYCRVLACDFDGTGASDGQLAPEVAAALGAARREGLTTLLVTGRVLEDLSAAAVDLTSFDAVVAENGALVWLPGRAHTIRLGTPPPEQFLGELRAHGVAFHAGAVVVGTWDRHAAEVLDLIRRLGLDSQLVFNRAAVMVLPSGVNKAVGVRRALEELGRSERNMIAFGDAENDRPLLAAAELGVVARGAVPAVAAAADDRLSQPGSAGVAHYIRGVLAAGGCVPTPPRQHVVLGADERDAPAALPASGSNVMISGDPRSGKSWLAGLVAERLLERGYLLCLIDPEGDYGTLARRPGILRLGTELALPSPTAVATVLREEPISLVLDLAALPLPQKVAYVEQLLATLEAVRAQTGLPHWIMVDEAHYFFGAGAACCRFVEQRTGQLLLMTYRPSQVAPEVSATIGAHLVTHTTVDDERYFVTGLLQARGPAGLPAVEALRAIEPPRAGLLVPPRWQVFTPGERFSSHAHHGRKYADSLVPADRAFRFQHAGRGTPAAHSLVEFCRVVATVPAASLRYHLIAGDFSRWVAEVIGDPELAAGLRKLEYTTRAGAAPSREEILRHVEDRYVLVRGVPDDPAVPTLPPPP